MPPPRHLRRGRARSPNAPQWAGNPKIFSRGTPCPPREVPAMYLGRCPLPLATAHLPLLRGVSQSRRGSVAPRRTKPRNPLRLHKRFFGIIFSSREAHCAARGHSPENGKPTGRLINVASTLHVVPTKYDQIFYPERHVGDDAPSWAHCLFCIRVRPLVGLRWSA